MVKYKKYSVSHLQSAVSDVAKGIPIKRAAKSYGLSHMTLKRHARKQLKGQPVRVLTAEEEIHLCTYIEYCQKRSLPLNVKMIKMFARSLIIKQGRSSTIGENGPSHKWFRNFLRRHPNLKIRKPQTLDGGRVRMSNETVMSQHFFLLKDTMQSLDIENKPHLVYNVDETGFGKGVTAQDGVCVNNGQGYCRQVVTTAHTTATVCVSGDGKVLPTFVIYEKGFPSGAYRDGIPCDWLFGASPNGYMDADLFRKWFKQVFLVHACKQRPLLLIMDNHESHMSIELIEIARANQVELFCLPPHTTHLLQPLDVVLFRPLKKAVTDLAVSLGYANPNLVIGKNRFAQILKAAVDKTFNPHTIKTGFRKCGICPINPNAIDKAKLSPCDPEFSPQPGPGGDNLSSYPLDPLCETCGQFVRGHLLVNQGLFPADLADIFLPIIGPAKKGKGTRIITKSRVITGDEIIKQLKEKDCKKQKTITKEITSTDHNETEMPVIQLPKRRRNMKKNQRTKNKTSDPQEDIITFETNLEDNQQIDSPLPDEEEYTCPICGQRGLTNDEANGILWVGCDNQACCLWFHRDCLPNEEHSEVDLSLLIGTDWFCHICTKSSLSTTQSLSSCQPMSPNRSTSLCHSTSPCQSTSYSRSASLCQSTSLRRPASPCQSTSYSRSASPCQSTSLHLPASPCQSPSPSNYMICQVCMNDQHETSPHDRTLFWATCEQCLGSYHQMCLPLNVYRAYEITKTSGSNWICGHCPTI